MKVLATNATSSEGGHKWTLAKFTHVLGIFAQYMDNDGDGCPDDTEVFDKLYNMNAMMLMS